MLAVAMADGLVGCLADALVAVWAGQRGWLGVNSAVWSVECWVAATADEKAVSSVEWTAVRWGHSSPEPIPAGYKQSAGSVAVAMVVDDLPIWWYCSSSCCRVSVGKV